MVPMVLKPHGIEPTFLKLDSWSLGAGFIPIITSNSMKKKIKFMHTKRFNTFSKNVYNPVLGSNPRIPPWKFVCFYCCNIKTFVVCTLYIVPAIKQIKYIFTFKIRKLCRYVFSLSRMLFIPYISHKKLRNYFIIVRTFIKDFDKLCWFQQGGSSRQNHFSAVRPI